MKVHVPKGFRWGTVAAAGALGLATVIALPGTASAESPDAGQTLATAADGTPSISGTMDATGDVDLYKVCITGTGAFSASVAAGGGDGQIFLFDDTGHGVAWNDDKATNQLEPGFPSGSSVLSALPAGAYYLGISNFNFDPYSATGAIFTDSATTVGDPVASADGPGAADPLSGWSGGVGIYPPMTSYTVTMTGTTPCTAPVLTLPADFTVAPDGIAGASSVTWSASASDNLDGALTPTCSPASGSAFGFGSTEVECSVTNSLGLTSEGSFTVTVSDLAWSGFYQPIDNGVLNTVKAGSTVPAKFNVTAGGVQVTDPDVGTVSWAVIPCPAQALTDAVEQTVTSASSELRWDSTGQQFVYNWRTPKTPGSCVQLRVTTSDQVVHSADFLLK